MSLFAGLFYYFGSPVTPPDSPLSAIIAESQCDTCLFSLAADSTTLVLNVPDLSSAEIRHMKSRLWSGAVISFSNASSQYPFIQAPDPPLPIALESPPSTLPNPFSPTSSILDFGNAADDARPRSPSVLYTRLSLWPGTLLVDHTTSGSGSKVNPAGLVIHDFAEVTSGVVSAFKARVEHRIRKYLLGLES
ncbi:hypothetical protein ACM66B_002521 [Microbotryomycetes sp. NB124-2]